MSEEWDASNHEFHALFILEDGASVATIWGVKGCTIIAIIYDLRVTVGESSRDSRSKEKKSSSISKDASHSQHKPSGMYAHVEEPSHTVDDSGVQQNQEFDTGNNDEQPAVKEVSKADWFKKPATTKRLDWHNPEGKPYPFDFSKPLPLIPDHRGRQVIPQDFFINNDLEYLKGGDLSRWYSTFIMKTKAATYEIKWIEDLVRNLWSPMKVTYDKHAHLGTSHWVPNVNDSKGLPTT
ncbi:hypothetical protein Tco_0643755 [Tanacetum coccineum]